MSEFNSKKFYGYSMQNDPDIAGTTWNTKNFEFSCVRPETVQRAIEKVGSDTGASLKQKKSNLLNKLREKCGDAENENRSYPDRDPDVETNMSQTQDMNTHESDDSIQSDRISDDGEKYLEKSKNSLRDDVDDVKGHKEIRSKRVKGGESVIANAYIEKYEIPQPKWVEVSEAQVASMQMFDIIPSQSPMLPAFGFPPVMYQAPYMYMPPVPQMMQSMGFNTNPQSMMGNFVYANPYGYEANLKTNPNQNTNGNAFEIEDSDLEDELMRREQYTKFCQTRPEIIEPKPIEEGEKCAEFINIAPQEPYIDMSFLKSTVAMRYSELSDEETPEEKNNRAPKVVIKKSQPETKEATLASNKSAAKPSLKNDPKKDKTLKARMASVARILEQERKIANQHAKKTESLTKKTKKNYSSPTTASINRKNVIRKQVQEAATNFLLNEKSVIKLKAEKEAIFSKMSRTHERLIDALQQLRNKLLEVYVPESTSDRNRRNRNGFEFSVRFLRNFLYPLKGMIDATRNTPKEHFNSLKSNDACNRVAHIYSLFLQAVLTYGKQLRHFMIDQVPQKLTTLLEMLFGATNMCLDKRLFDRNDAIVESLLSHCANFLAFLEDLHAQRFVAAQESQRKVCMVQETQSKYDLKMIINDLNMYEPRIVPKKQSVARIDSRVARGNKSGNSIKSGIQSAPASQQQPQQNTVRRIRRRAKQTKTASKRQQQGSITAMGGGSSSDVNEPKRIEQDVLTQVQDCGQRSSEYDPQDSQEIIESLQSMLKATPDLERFGKVELINQSILNALRYSQNQNTQEILEPLLHTIDAIMKLPKADNEIENDFKAFQMRISSLLNERKTQQGCDEGYSLDDSAEDTAFYDTRSKLDEFLMHEKMAEQYVANEGISDLDSEHAKNEENQFGPKNDNEYNQNHNNIDDNYADDIDGKFYISGEDCSAKRTTRSRKSKLEPLVEIANEREIAELFSSDAEMYTPLRSKLNSKQKQKPMEDSELMELIFSPAKSSPYDIPLSRRSRKTPKKPKSPEFAQQTGARKGALTNKTSQSQTTTAINSNRAISSRNKMTTTTTVPPSPAMMRLKQLGQPPLTARSRKVNILKKHIRRNPTGSPPPPPTVSPSTSLAHTPSLESHDLHQSMSNVSTSNKGCSVNITRNSPKLAHPDVTRLGSLSNGRSEKNSKQVSQRTSLHSMGKKNSGIIVVDNVGERATVAIDEPSNKYKSPEGSNKIINEKSMPEDGCGDQKHISPLASPEHVKSKTDVKAASQQNVMPEPNLRNADMEGTTVNFDDSSLLKERDTFLSMCIRNPLYNNPNFTSLWKLLGRFSQQLTNEIVMQVESDLDCGVKNFVNDFLKLETRI